MSSNTITIGGQVYTYTSATEAVKARKEIEAGGDAKAIAQKYGLELVEDELVGAAFDDEGEFGKALDAEFQELSEGWQDTLDNLDFESLEFQVTEMTDVASIIQNMSDISYTWEKLGNLLTQVDEFNSANGTTFSNDTVEQIKAYYEQFGGEAGPKEHQQGYIDAYATQTSAKLDDIVKNEKDYNKALTTMDIMHDDLCELQRGASQYGLKTATIMETIKEFNAAKVQTAEDQASSAAKDAVDSIEAPELPDDESLDTEQATEGDPEEMTNDAADEKASTLSKQLDEIGKEFAAFEKGGDVKNAQELINAVQGIQQNLSTFEECESLINGEYQSDAIKELADKYLEITNGGEPTERMQAYVDDYANKCDDALDNDIKQTMVASKSNGGLGLDQSTIDKWHDELCDLVISVENAGLDTSKLIEVIQQFDVVVAQAREDEPTQGPTQGPEPEPTTKEPGPTTEIPEPTTKEPDPTTKDPDPTTKDPDPTTEIPGPTTKEPDPTTKEPNPTTEIPGPTTKEPDPTTKEPDPTTEIPGPTTKEPDPTTKETDPTTEIPGPTTKEPDPTTKEPDPTTEIPGPTTKEPDPTTKEPDPTTGIPGPTTKEPDPTTKEDDNPNPDPSVDDPTTVIPEPTTQEPTTVIPEPTTQEPTTNIPAPTTQEPTTDIPAPTTQEPLPTTEAPTTSAPDPTTEAPAPTTQEPEQTTCAPEDDLTPDLTSVYQQAEQQAEAVAEQAVVDVPQESVSEVKEEVKQEAFIEIVTDLTE